MEAFPEIIPEGDRGINEIPGQKKEQWNMEGINDLIKKRRDGSKVIMPQYDQQNADASCNVQVLDPFGHDDISSALILPRDGR